MTDEKTDNPGTCGQCEFFGDNEGAGSEGHGCPWPESEEEKWCPPYRALEKLKGMKKEAITVWKDGTWKAWARGDAHYAEADPDWLSTINLDELDKLDELGEPKEEKPEADIGAGLKELG